MDDFKENSSENLNDTEDFTESTIFSAPKQHNDEKLKSSKKRRIIAAISALLAVCMLVGGTLAVIKLIPKKEEETTSEAEKLLVLDLDKSKFDVVTVENKNGQFVFYPKTDKGEDDSDIKWYVEGLSEEKISTSKTGDTVSAAAKIEAVMEITKKSFEECGLNSPVARVSVKSKKLGDFTLSFGDVSPDNTGSYLYSSIDEKIYLVAFNIPESFNFTSLDLANTDAVPSVSGDSELSSYVENGCFTTFDSLTLSGSKFKNAITIMPLGEDSASNVGFLYEVTSPMRRYADPQNTNAFMSVFNSGILVSGVYSFDTDAASLKSFGLDNPEVSVTLKVAGKSFTYNFAPNSDGYYAVFGYGMNTIKKISSSAVEFLSLKEDDIYNKMVYIRSISQIKNMTFLAGNKEYCFDISENDEEADEKYTVYYGNKKINSGNFQNFYMHFVSLSLIDFSAGPLGTADMTVTITDTSGKKEVLAFYKASATQYSCSLDGKPIGKIAASSYNKLVSDIKTVSENKDVEV